MPRTPVEASRHVELDPLTSSLGSPLICLVSRSSCHSDSLGTIEEVVYTRFRCTKPKDPQKGYKHLLRLLFAQCVGLHVSTV